jgi:hypothetical protein
MNEVVFDTEAEAEAQQALDLVDHLEAHNEEPYRSQTIRWATPRQRLDGKWAYPCCDHSDYTGMTTEPHDPANYPTEETYYGITES